jgi:hypothetical protein
MKKSKVWLTRICHELLTTSSRRRPPRSVWLKRARCAASSSAARAAIVAITKCAYARERDVHPSTVQTWIYRGKLVAPAVFDDGRIDPDLADRQLAAAPDGPRVQVFGGC